MRIVVYADPAPQGSKSFVGLNKKTGKGMMRESSTKVKPWREAVRFTAVDVRVRERAMPMTGPVMARMIFTLRRPDSAPKRRRLPDRQPDLSKLIRSTEDALTNAGVWVDDSQVVEYQRTAKLYVGSDDPEALDAPGVVIVVWPLEDQTSNIHRATSTALIKRRK